MNSAVVVVKPRLVLTLIIANEDDDYDPVEDNGVCGLAREIRKQVRLPPWRMGNINGRPLTSGKDDNRCRKDAHKLASCFLSVATDAPARPHTICIAVPSWANTVERE